MSRNEPPITAIIVDDEPLALEGLKLRLEKIPQVTVIGEASDGDEAIKLCQELSPTVLFLDLQLPGINGLEVIQALQSDILPMVVFVSAYSEYAIDAFELNAIDYILKPANLGRLQKTIDRINERRSPKQSENEKYRLLSALGETSGLDISELEDWLETDLPLPAPFRQEFVIKTNEHERIVLNVNDIRWIDAAGDYMCIHTKTETHVVRITMKKLQAELDSRMFCRVHKSTLVNLHCIKGIQTLKNNEAILDLGEDVQVKVSRNYSSTIQQLIKDKHL
ncbi:LytR/AlgR family response regulator transcription factor [Thalassotalea aquiviva]|uniref:LytR/AlgR family response regulator transcription factor n=1 Tax=Thalassotalea aquiviva TaxID=3242415 RepID=UPI00352BD09E